MVLNDINVNMVSFQKLFGDYYITQAQIDYYTKIAENGGIKKAIDLFIEQNIVSSVEKYNTQISEFLIESEKGELPTHTRKNILKIITLVSFSMGILLNKNFNSFISKVISPIVFSNNAIKTKIVKDIILESTLSQFENITSKTLHGTQSYLLKNIRDMQKEMIIFNQNTKKITGVQLDKITASFLKSMKKKFPEYQKMKEGKLVASSYGVDGNIRFYKLQNYIEMSARTTLLNINRTSVNISILNKEAKRSLKKGRTAVNVAEYYLADNRVLKTGIERIICQKVLSDTKYGVSLVALDEPTAIILGIPSLDSAIAEGAFSVWCRHGIRPITVSMRKKLEKILLKEK